MTSGHTRRRYLWGLAATMVVALALVGCGLSTNDEPEPIARENLPDSLETEPPTSFTLPTGPDGIAATIWLMQSDAAGTWLHAVPRRVPRPLAADESTAATSLLGALLDSQPSPEENQAGIFTAIPADAHLTAPPEVDDSVLVVNLSPAFYELRGASSRQAVAQVVYTATEIPGIEEVRFELDGSLLAVTDGEGEAVRHPVRRTDYENLILPEP